MTTSVDLPRRRRKRRRTLDATALSHGNSFTSLSSNAVPEGDSGESSGFQAIRPSTSGSESEGPEPATPAISPKEEPSLAANLDKVAAKLPVATMTAEDEGSSRKRYRTPPSPVTWASRQRSVQKATKKSIASSKTKKSRASSAAGKTRRRHKFFFQCDRCGRSDFSNGNALGGHKKYCSKPEYENSIAKQRRRRKALKTVENTNMSSPLPVKTPIIGDHVPSRMHRWTDLATVTSDSIRAWTSSLDPHNQNSMEQQLEESIRSNNLVDMQSIHDALLESHGHISKWIFEMESQGVNAEDMNSLVDSDTIQLVDDLFTLDSLDAGDGEDLVGRLDEVYAECP